MTDFAPTVIDALWAVRYLIAAAFVAWLIWFALEIAWAPVEEYPGQCDAALAPELIAKRDRTWAEAAAMWEGRAAQVDAEWARIEAVIDAEDIAAWEREMGEVA